MKRIASLLVAIVLIGTLEAQAFDFVSRNASRYAFTLQIAPSGIQGLQLLMTPPAPNKYQAHIYIHVLTAPSPGVVDITIKDTDGNVLTSATGFKTNDIVELNLNTPGSNDNTPLRAGKGVLLDVSGDGAQIYIFIDAEEIFSWQ